MLNLEKEQVKRAVENAVLTEDIDNRVLRQFAEKYGVETVLDFVRIYDQEYPERKEEDRRSFHIPALRTITRKAHNRLF